MTDTDATRTQDRVLPDTIPADERSALHEREGALRRDGDTTSLRSTVGLALSGGGIRSATFCIGLLRGLARNGVLPRLDYLSTVSGGGYAGAAFGRLVSALGLVRAQALLQRNDSMALAWLRRYGRYLTPRGARDYGAAFATYLRAGIAIHLEFGLMAMLAGCLLVLPHFLQNDLSLLATEQWEGWASAWWPLAAACWLALVPGSLVSYWMLRDVIPEPGNAEPKGARIAFGDLVVIAAAAATAVWIGITVWVPGSGWWRAPPLLVALMLGLASVAVHGTVLAVRCLRSRGQARGVANAQLRNRMTSQLRLFNLVTLLLVAAGALDLLSWWLMNVLQSDSAWVYGGLGVGGVLLAVVRAYAEPLQKLANADDGPSLGLGPRLLNLLGIGVALLLLLAWVTLVQWWVFDAVPAVAQLPVLDNRGGRLGLLAAALVAWLLLTAWNAETANTSSMHNFYRARLTRAYLGVGNPARKLDDLPSPGPAGADNPERVSDVTSVVPGDDVALADYRPELKGGPLHLVNVCLNQTRGGRSGLYNADRKGESMIASARGLEVAREGTPVLLQTGLDTLGRWVAISGAAAAPGAGAYTTRGWALLLFLAGARLGYWLKVGRERAFQPASRFREALRGSKAGRLLSEAMGKFHGQSAASWYLSDGGHFDNTGVHALLRRQLDFIILADCGADPQYQFGDLENLVRKARIDFGTDIEFYTHESAGRLPLPTDSQINILAPEDLRNLYTARGVLLARIRYPEADGERRVGTLLVVKPNLHWALDSDVLAYAGRNPLFPQQPTSDQFFDEAQWESYHRLGEDFGEALHPRWLARIPGWSSPVEGDDELPPLRRLQFRPSEPDAAAAPFWRVNAKTAAIGATVGLGVLVTLLVPLMQVFDRIEVSRQATVDRTVQHIDTVTAALDRWQETPEVPPPASDAEKMSMAALYRQVADVRVEDAGDSDAGALVYRAQQQCSIVPTGTLGGFCRQDTSPFANPERSALCEYVCTQPGLRYYGYWQESRDITPQAEIPLDLSPEVGEMAGASIGAPPEVAPVIAPPPATDPVPSAGTDIPMPPPPPPPPPVDSSLQACRQGDRDALVYVHVYDEATRARANLVALPDADSGVRVQGIENVVSTATARKARPPTPYRTPTLIVHDLPRRQACADAVAAWVQQRIEPWYGKDNPVAIAPLPSRFRPVNGVIELWLPPVDSTYGGHRETSKWANAQAR